MQQIWNEIADKAKEAAEDFKVFCHGIQSIADALRNDYRFFTNNSNTPNFEITNLPALQEFYNQSLEKAKRQIVRNEQRAGNNIRSFHEYLNQAKDGNERTTRSNNAKLKAWTNNKGKFLELLCLLSTLSKMKPSSGILELRNVLDKSMGPIPILDNGSNRHLWTQQTLSDTNSGLDARPDIVFATPDKFVTTRNVISIVECKCVRKINSKDIRAEFGKAHDLRISSYTIITYYDAGQRIVDAAKKLGIDIIPFRLHTRERDTYIRDPRQLVESLAEDLQRSREEKNFLGLLDTAADEARKKLLPPI